MKFKIDLQTRTDLQLFGEDNSIASIFQKTKTEGGRLIIRKMMETPTSDINELTERISSIVYIGKEKFSLNIKKRLFDDIHHYIEMGYPIIKNTASTILRVNLEYLVQPSSDLFNIHNGVLSIIQVFECLKSKIQDISFQDCPNELKDRFEKSIAILELKPINDLLTLAKKKKLKVRNTLKYDHALRKMYKAEVLFICDLIYQIDACETISSVARNRNFCFPNLINTVQNTKSDIDIIGLFHPLLIDPVGNQIAFEGNKNLCLLSGPNMAGKSTFLKSYGIAIYLAHIGFPVPAKEMRTTLFNGLSTTINLSDNLKRGHSHFYSEVIRIKEVVNDIKELGRIVIIFDELFRGTNMKDAFDGSVLLARKFARLKHCKIFLSTHIIEVVEKLSFEKLNVLLKYFDATIENNELRFDYSMKDGYTDQRLGSQIIEKEKIIEALTEILAKFESIH